MTDLVLEFPPQIKEFELQGLPNLPEEGLIIDIQGQPFVIINTGGGGGGGSKWYTGALAPNILLGVDGDFYLRSTNGDYYEKIAGAWVVQGNLTGPAGANGADGATWLNGSGAPSPLLGVDGDYYIDTASADYYTKVAGVWNLLGNLEGPTGPSGVVAATTPLSYNGGTQTVSIQQATNAQNGYLSSTDWNTFNTKFDKILPAANQMVYVNALSGSNVTGDGSFSKPYQTVIHALTTITDASLSKPYTIALQSNRQIETGDVLMKPYVFIAGVMKRATYFRVNAGSVKPDPSYASTTGWTGFKNLYVGGSTVIDFDLQLIGGTAGCLFITENCDITGTFTYKGRTGGGGDFLEAYVGIFYTTVTIDSVYFQIQNKAFGGAINCTNTQAIAMSGNILNSSLGGNMSIDSMTLGVSNLLFDSTTSTFTSLNTCTVNSNRGLPPVSRRVLSGGTTLVNFDNASMTPYSPSVPANWPVSPSEVAAGLDSLAANKDTAAYTVPANSVLDSVIDNTKTKALDALGIYQGKRVNHFIVMRDPFCTGAIASMLGWAGSNSGTGAAFGLFQPYNADYIGSVRGSTGTTATGRTSLGMGATSFCFGNNKEFFVSFRGVVLTSALPDGSDNYFVNLGANDVNTAADCIDGVYWKYDHTVSPNWLLVMSNNSVRDTINTGIAVADNVLYDLDYYVNPAGNSVTCWVNGTLITTLATANVPITNARSTGFRMGINKTLGANARLLQVHGFYCRIREVI